MTSVFLAIPGSNLVGRYSLSPYTSLQKIISIPFIVNKISLLVSSTYVRNNHFLTNQMFFDYYFASFSSTHSKARQSDVIGCREHRIRNHGSISTLLTKLLKTLTLRYRCRYLPCAEQSLFDKSDVFRFSCRSFCIKTFENMPFGCNLMPQTR